MGNEEDVAFLVAALTAQGLSIHEIEQHIAQYLLFATEERHIPIPDVTFDLEAMSEAQCEDRFRFTKPQIKTLVRMLNIPDPIKSAQRVPVPAVEAVCLMLRRLSYPCRYRDLVLEFGRQPSVLSSVFNTILLLVHSRIAAKMVFDEFVFTKWAAACADSVHRKCGYLHDCLGYIDGTARPICRPGEFQKEVYSGHKKFHCLKYQGVMMANGLLVSLFGPIEGRRHDMFLLSESGLEDRFCRVFPDRYLYGDAGYGLKKWLLRPFQAAKLTREQIAFNRAMSAGRVSVEWFFGEVVQYWAYVDFKKGMKIGKSPVGSMYIVAVFLTNALMCARGSSKTAVYHDCPLPTLEEYLSNVDRHAFPGDGSEVWAAGEVGENDEDEEEDADEEDEGQTPDEDMALAADTSPSSPPSITHHTEQRADEITLPTLSSTQLEIIDRVLFGSDQAEVVAMCDGRGLTRKSMRCLQPLQWLNDEVVNAWFRLLQNRDSEMHAMGLRNRQTMFFNTFFFTSLAGLGYNYSNVQRWTRGINVFAMEKVFIPVNVTNTHWCLAVIYVAEKRIQCYDSLGGHGDRCVQILLRYLGDEMEDKLGQEFDPSGWRLETRSDRVPQQQNGSDCGVFVCLFADYLSRDTPLDFTQAHATFHRQTMVLEIVNGQLPVEIPL